MSSAVTRRRAPPLIIQPKLSTKLTSCIALPAAWKSKCQPTASLSLTPPSPPSHAKPYSPWSLVCSVPSLTLLHPSQPLTSHSTVSPFGAKLPVPALAPSTPLQLREFEAAGIRRANRLQARQQQPAAHSSARDVGSGAAAAAAAAATAAAASASASAAAAAAGRSLVTCSSTSVTVVNPRPSRTHSHACVFLRDV